MKERIDIYNKYGEKTGKTIVRGEPFGEGEYCRVVQVVVFHPDGRLLIQQRQSDKQAWPNQWDLSVAGVLQAGEDSRHAAARELREELGINHDFSEDIPKISVFYGQGFTDVFYLTMDVDPKTLTLQQEEVQDCRLAAREEVLELLAQGKFVNYHRSWLEYLFDRQQYKYNFT